jgi:peptidoglycan-associated lipoprotein
MVTGLTIRQNAAGLAVLFLNACTTPPEIPPVAAAAPVVGQSQSAAGQGNPPQSGLRSPLAATIVPGSLQDFQENVGDRVHFDYDQAQLGSAAQDTLRRQAAWLQRYPSVSLIIEGHSDERGTRDYNLALSARRASAVMTYLVTMGISAARLDTVSYGKERPSCTDSAESCWEQNRRGVSTIKGGAMTAGT